jgi:hypothetical protein
VDGGSESGSDATQPRELDGLDRLLAEFLGRPRTPDLTSVVVRTLALIETLGAEVDFPVIGLDRSNAVVRALAEALEVPPDDIIRARRDAAVNRRGAIATLAHELQFHVAVPAVGLMIAEGPGGTLFLAARRPKTELIPPLDLGQRPMAAPPNRRNSLCPAAATLGAFSTSGAEINLNDASIRIQL